MIEERVHVKDEWTLSLGSEAGEVLMLAFHKVEVVKILERRPNNVLAKVKVLGPVADAAGAGVPTPPMMWAGELWDTMGILTPQTKDGITQPWDYAVPHGAKG